MKALQSLRSTKPSQLTFRHWAGFSPYISSYELARTCVSGKQSIPRLLLCPPLSGGRASLEITPSCFAEFLELPSLALLSLLDQTTCVGYRYDLMTLSLRSFSWMLNADATSPPKVQCPITARLRPPCGKQRLNGFAYPSYLATLKVNSNYFASYQAPSLPKSNDRHQGPEY